MEDVDENVEILNVDTKKAFDNFTGRYLDPSGSGKQCQYNKQVQA
jgi:hypothetical protein